MFNGFGLIQRPPQPHRLFFGFGRGIDPLAQQIQRRTAFLELKITGVNTGLLRVDVVPGQGFQCLLEPGQVRGFEGFPEPCGFCFGFFHAALGRALQVDVALDQVIVEVGKSGTHVGSHKGQRLLLGNQLGR